MEDIQVIDFTKTKKLAKNAKKVVNISTANNLNTNVFDYEMLLTRINNMLRQNNPDSVQKHKVLKIKNPVISKPGGNKCLWTNFKEICNQLNRHEEHLMKFITNELLVEGCINSNNLLLKGKFNAKQIENLIKKYIKEYVQCDSCQSLKTILIKNNQRRAHIMECTNCTSRKTVIQ